MSGGCAGPRRLWLVSAGLVIFGLLPGLARLLVELAGDPDATQGSLPAVSRLPVVVHGVAGTGFVVLGAFQFPAARQRARTWHRRAGRLLVPMGLAATMSGLWLTLFYPNLRDSGAPLTAFRVTFSTAMAASILTSLIAIRRRDVPRHRAWMIRAYALGLGASTQIFTLGFGGAAFGTGEVSTALLTGAGWVINLGAAEWVIRRPNRPGSLAHRRVSPPRGVVGSLPAQGEASSCAGVRTFMRSPGRAKMLRISAGRSPMLPNQCGTEVSNSAISPGPRTQS